MHSKKTAKQTSTEITRTIANMSNDQPTIYQIRTVDMSTIEILAPIAFHEIVDCYEEEIKKENPLKMRGSIIKMRSSFAQSIFLKFPVESRKSDTQ